MVQGGTEGRGEDPGWKVGGIKDEKIEENLGSLVGE